MTLIVTTISDLGILQGSDSNLTRTTTAGVATPAGEGQKLFRLDFCHAALAIAGSYEIAGVRMDTWMSSTARDFSSSSSPSLEGFARYLQERLSVDGTPGKTALLIHIAGYVTDARGSHPEMWFVRNFAGMDPTTGAYIDRTDDFLISEDFWNRDYPDDVRIGRGSLPGYGRRYFNGIPEGRISFSAISQMLEGFLGGVWAAPGWAFRAPRDVAEASLFMRLESNVIGTLFEVSDYAAPFVGGRAQIELIPAPSDALPL
jgi:hypothetical protein